MHGKLYDRQFKKTVFQAIRDRDLSARETSQEFSIPSSTAQYWVRKARKLRRSPVAAPASSSQRLQKLETFISMLRVLMEGIK